MNKEVRAKTASASGFSTETLALPRHFSARLESAEDKSSEDEAVEDYLCPCGLLPSSSRPVSRRPISHRPISDYQDRPFPRLPMHVHP